jgi:hypothetical protein
VADPALNDDRVAFAANDPVADPQLSASSHPYPEGKSKARALNDATSVFSNSR